MLQSFGGGGPKRLTLVMYIKNIVTTARALTVRQGKPLSRLRLGDSCHPP
jgi:hypothetical protein